MKRLIQTLKLLLYVLIVTSLQNCQKDKVECNDPRNPECVNYDPCIDAKIVSAAFTMFEEGDALRLNPFWEYYDTDTSVWNNVRFTALEENAKKYTWYIGTELQPRFGKSLTIDFSSNKTPKLIRLIVEKEPNSTCLPNDDGVDTVDRMLYFIDRYDTLNMPIFGRFQGVSSENLQETRVVTIGYYYTTNTGANNVTFTGFNECTAYVSSGLLGYRFFPPWQVNHRTFLPNGGGMTPRCNLFDVIVRLPDNTDSIYVQYKNWSPDSTLYVFRGTKIQ